MARPSSELLKGIGGWFDIVKALADAILRLQGDDEVLKQVKNPAIADEIATMLMARAGIPKPAPDTSGLRILKITVRGSDSRWQRIEPSKYAYCNQTARTGDFPIDPTDREVTVAIFPANYFDDNPTNEVLRAEIERRHLTHPDRAVTETTLDVLKDELAEKPTVGVCGVVQSDTHGYQLVGYVRESADGRRLSLYDLQSRWFRSCQFVAVVSE